MATNASMKALRNQLVLSYAENVIDSEDLILLYDANMSKGIYPIGNIHISTSKHLMMNKV